MVKFQEKRALNLVYWFPLPQVIPLRCCIYASTAHCTYQGIFFFKAEHLLELVRPSFRYSVSPSVTGVFFIRTKGLKMCYILILNSKWFSQCLVFSLIFGFSNLTLIIFVWQFFLHVCLFICLSVTSLFP